MANPRVSVLPWPGGLNTSLDESLIGAGQLTQTDNVVLGVRKSKKKREGINHNWDGATATSDAIIGQHDFWFGNTTRTQALVTVYASGKVAVKGAGTETVLTTVGTAWTGTLSSCSMLTFNNKCFIAVSGPTNVLKYWDGTNPLADAFSAYNVVSLTRASAGSSRTLKFNAAFPGTVGSTLIIAGALNQAYNGTYTVATITTGSVANDTITYTATTSLTEASTSDTGILAGKPAPLPSILQEHQGRIFCNNKADPDQLLYTPANDHTLWMGAGDSGGFPVKPGDGDSLGISGIFPTFKGDLFIGKKAKLYRMFGETPEDWQIITVSTETGVESHNAIVPIGTDDVMWLGEKGIHSLAAVQAYGDFTTVDVSGDIQGTFNSQLDLTRLKYAWGAYIPQYNSVVFTLTEKSSRNRVNTTNSINNALYFYNLPNKSWYRWPDLSCQSLISANDTDGRRLYIGTHTGRVSRAMTGLRYDTASAGTHLAIGYKLVTGMIYPTGDSYDEITFLKFVLYYRPTGRHNLTVNVYIDDQALSQDNTLAFTGSSSASALGVGFKLGFTPLGSKGAFGAYERSLSGTGHGCKIAIEQADVDADMEIFGFAVEYEVTMPAGAPGATS